MDMKKLDELIKSLIGESFWRGSMCHDGLAGSSYEVEEAKQKLIDFIKQNQKVDTMTTLDELREEAEKQLTNAGEYEWGHGDDSCPHAPKPKLSKAIDFMQYYGVIRDREEDLTCDAMFREILDSCGKGYNNVAQAVTIKYMSEVIAYWEFEELKKLNK